MELWITRRFSSIAVIWIPAIIKVSKGSSRGSTKLQLNSSEVRNHQVIDSPSLSEPSWTLLNPRNNGKQHSEFHWPGMIFHSSNINERLCHFHANIHPNAPSGANPQCLVTHFPWSQANSTFDRNYGSFEGWTLLAFERSGYWGWFSFIYWANTVEGEEAVGRVITPECRIRFSLELFVVRSLPLQFRPFAAVVRLRKYVSLSLTSGVSISLISIKFVRWLDPFFFPLFMCVSVS